MEERTLKEILSLLSHHTEEYLNAPIVECTIKVRIKGRIEEYKYPKVSNYGNKI